MDVAVEGKDGNNDNYNVLYDNYMCVSLFLLQHTSTSNIYILFK